MVLSITLRLFFLLVFCFVVRGEEDFWGCGGFVQVDRKTSLDLSKVEIRLYTKQGNLKYHTDCAPNNGYYFIPIYDKGDYVIKLVSPDGWGFEPTAVSLSIDKVNDQCSQGKDINFMFKGFTVNGKVLSHGKNVGPAGVTVQLLSDGTTLQTVTTEPQGVFSFQNILPGLYTIKANHPKWQFSSDQRQIVIESDSVVVNEGLEVQGYDVQGHVTSDGEPIQGVKFSLYSKSQSATSCGLESVSESISEDGWNLICETLSDLKGSFLFPVVPPGHYKMIPVYRGENIQFDIRPSLVEFDVQDESHIIAQKFEVEGFRVSGRVLEKPQGEGLAGAKIYLNGKHVATSGQDGHYNLENIKTGSYHLTAEADQMDFDRLTVRISPNNPSLPDISAAAYQVCGQIDLSNLPASLAGKARQVIFLPIGDAANALEPTLLSTDGQGSFCSLLKPGSYKLEPMALEAEVEAGLKFVPAFHEVTVGHIPQSGFSFTQFRASIRGRIQLIGSNQDISLQLSGSAGKTTQTVTTSDGQFEFDNVLPGKYSIGVQQEAWCWRSKVMEVEVVDRDVGPIEFEQLGFFFTVTTSHDIDLSYVLNGQVPGSLSLKSGTSKHCLEGMGTYVFTPISCHTFEPESVEWSTSEPSVVNFKATHHRTGVVIQSDHHIEDLEVSATSSGGEVLKLNSESVAEEKSGQWIHQFIFDGRSGETYQVEPSANALLFFPSKLTLNIASRCNQRAGIVIAQKGLYLTGFIHPPISGVEISITSDTLNDAVVVSTDASGSYVFGPVNKDGHQPVVDLESAFRISAHKKGYIFQKSASRFGDFLAEKLAEIGVVVSDAHSGDPLAGVLVAAAGGVGYRQNSLTASDGKVTLSELNPGDYFIKPVLKEYRFDPISKLVHIDDGATVELLVRGERVAFSCYGTVTALNGEPESSVTIEAVGVGPSCAEYQEESSSETNGQFRIRGLLPQCQYVVRPKNGNGFNNKNIQRTLPAHLPVKVGNSDVTGLRFVAIKSINQADVVVSVAVEQRDYLKTLKLKLFRQDQPDEVVYSIKLDQSPLVVLPPLAMDGKRYFIQLESNLGRSIYDYQTQEVSFTANVSAQQVKMEFQPKRKAVDGETVQVSVRGILLVLLCGIAGYNYQTLSPVLQKTLSTISAALKSGKDNSSSSAPSSANSREPVFSEQELALFADNTTTTNKKKVKPRRA